MDHIDQLLEQLTTPDKRGSKSRAGRIGPSDIGGCRRRIMYIRTGAEARDPGYWLGAKMGTAFHAVLADAAAEVVPDCLTEHALSIQIGGRVIEGTCDLIIPGENLIVDHKTAADLSWVSADAPDHKHALQVATYALGAAQAGLIDIGKAKGQIVTWDRSGRSQKPVVVTFDITGELIQQAAAWVSSVEDATAVEDFEREAPPSWCHQLCEFFDICRPYDGPDPDAEVIEAVEGIKAARAEIKAAEARKRFHEQQLAGYPGGRVGDTMVSWVNVREKYIDGHTRKGYTRLQITTRKKAGQ